jgi:alpha/beta superfamily hydrolase
MVSKGQFLERPALIPVGRELLDGLYHPGELRPPVLILPPPPNEGSMDHPLAAELAWAATRAGFPTLRFNFRGVGGSPGARGDEQSRLQDAEAALWFLEENVQQVASAVASIGSSAPTLMALHRLHPGLAGLCLISPREVACVDLARVALPLLAIIGEQDTALSRAALAACVSEAGGRLVLIPQADATLQRNLPEVGREVVRWLKDL